MNQNFLFKQKKHSFDETIQILRDHLNPQKQVFVGLARDFNFNGCFGVLFFRFVGFQFKKK